MKLQLDRENRIYVTVKGRINKLDAPILIGQLMSHFFFIPDGKVDRKIEPLEFAWMPNLHRTENGVCGDHFFRSPAIMVYADGVYAAIVPDLDVFAQNYSIQHALDLRVIGSGNIEAPRLSYGICPYEVDGHVYTKHEPDNVALLESRELCYAFYLFVSRAQGADHVSRMITSFLWKTYGKRFFSDVRPQVLPFEEYGRRYTYFHELPRSVKHITINGHKCVGINNSHRRGANFHAWENDLHVGFGVKHYAEKWNDSNLRDIADGILRLSLQAPRNQGAFPCIYNFEDGRYEGSLFWTARPADFWDGYDSAAMGVSAWWQLYWYENFDMDAEVLESVREYAHFLKASQLPSGAIPTYFFEDLTPAKQLKESATTAISGALLAKVAKLTGEPELKKAALEAGRYIEEEIIPKLLFSDFEVYYSCSPKPLHAIDYWSGIPPHNTLSIQWTCDQMLALYHLTGDTKWLKHGEYVLSILSLYQQVWNPAHRSGYLYGGFGVMNTDGEWNDGRQAQFVPTYADYYIETGNIEYLERAVAACRASFALMDTPENHENEINRTVMGKNLSVPAYAEPGMGYAGENIHHSGRENHVSGWTGMNWSSGGGLGASAYLERHFGNLCIDCAKKIAVPIDGLKVNVDAWDDTNIVLTVESALKVLKFPFTSEREITVKFYNLQKQDYTVTINGQPFGRIGSKEMNKELKLILTD